MNKSINSDIDLSDLLNYSKKYLFLYMSSIIVISLFFILYYFYFQKFESITTLNSENIKFIQQIDIHEYESILKNSSLNISKIDIISENQIKISSESFSKNDLDENNKKIFKITENYLNIKLAEKIDIFLEKQINKLKKRINEREDKITKLNEIVKINNAELSENIINKDINSEFTKKLDEIVINEKLKLYIQKKIYSYEIDNYKKTINYLNYKKDQLDQMISKNVFDESALKIIFDEKFENLSDLDNYSHLSYQKVIPAIFIKKPFIKEYLIIIILTLILCLSYTVIIESRNLNN